MACSLPDIMIAVLLLITGAAMVSCAVGAPPPTPLPPPRLGAPSPSRRLPIPGLGAPLPPPRPPPRLGMPLPSPPRPPPRLGAPLRSPTRPPPRSGAPLPSPPWSPPRLGAPLPSSPLPPPQLGAPPPPVVAPGGPKVPALFAFGDSMVDTGNNNHIRTIMKSNFPPYGRDFLGHKATGRFSDGKISMDFLAGALGLKEMLPPYLDKNLTMQDLKTGVSFASAGSGYDNATCRTTSAITLERQLQLFTEYKAKVGVIPERALYLTCWGSSDVVQHFTFADGITEPDYADFLTRRASTFIQRLIDLGAQQFAVVGMPPVGCVPAQRVTAGGLRRQCATDRNQLALLFNRKLSLELAKLAGRSPRGINLVFVDLYPVLADVEQRYEALGFKNFKDACCGHFDLETGVLCKMASRVCQDPTQYVFWDAYHPTEKAYKIIIDQLVAKYIRSLH